MNGLDIVILGALFLSALIGALRGFTKEILSLFSWGGAIALSYLLLPIARGFVQPYVANPMMADGVALFSLFIILLIMLSIIANMIAGYIHESSFRGVDHSLGFGFGILRGVVFISAAELIFSTFSPRHAQSLTVQSARFIPMVRNGGDTLLGILPASLRATILEQALKVESQVNAKVQDHLTNTAPHVFSSGVSGGPGEASGATPDGGMSQGGPGYAVGAPMANNPPYGQPPMPQQMSPQMQPQGGQHYGPQAQGVPVQSQMLVIRPPQASQLPQIMQAPPQNTVSQSREQVRGQGNTPGGLGASSMPQDTQLTVDNLSRLNPKSSPSKEDKGYTRGQLDDMDRLFQEADGE
ncbi:MAG: CvpA family protein [Alphaproteobacteria bacterium]|jgi:uncharacterized membrane protein required for colicin V production|nr:CvpA family protein [Alphaproteobacteria bacterium]